jgi:lipoprotein-releasing system permease protein
MNGFQLGFIDSILEISSYHIRVESTSSAGIPGDAVGLDEVLGAVRRTRGVIAAVPFLEIQGIARGTLTMPQGCSIRAIPPDTLSLDSGFASRVEIVEGKFSLSAPRSIVIGSELARSIGVGLGDSISLLTAAETRDKGLKPLTSSFVITGLFKSGYYEYDAGMAFISLADGGMFFASPPPIVIGVKLADRYSDDRVAGYLAAMSKLSGCRIESWRDFNRAFFGALRTEKTLMMFVIGLIFLVVGVNIYHSLRRAVYERREEIGLLRAIGSRPGDVRAVFICNGALIGGSGALAGLLLGLFLSNNINGVFAFAEALVNGVFFIARTILSTVGDSAASSAGSFSIFSPAYFYLTEVPSRILYPEALLIFLFGLLSATGAAFFASRQVSGVLPAEALRYE